MDGIHKRLGDVEKSILPLQNFFKVTVRRRLKATTDATADGSVATAPSAQPLIVTKWSERISVVLNFLAPLYTLFLWLQLYLDASSALVEAFWGSWSILSLVMRVHMGGGVTATRLLLRSQGAILMRISLPEVPGSLRT